MTFHLDDFFGKRVIMCGIMLEKDHCIISLPTRWLELGGMFSAYKCSRAFMYFQRGPQRISPAFLFVSAGSLKSSSLEWERFSSRAFGVGALSVSALGLPVSD